MTENISLDGIFIKTDHQVAAGNRGTVCVKKEKTIFVCANCVVVLNDHDGLGIQFKSLDYDSFAHIKALVYRHQPHIQ